MKFGTANPVSTALYRADTHARPSIVLRRKRCACGKVATAKQLNQYGRCDACRREATTTIKEAA